ncbi:MAG: Membrane protein insertase, YidC/Oxa1 family [Desulfotomaculum sp. 46_296]|nr:MAG: Membrane protein insertase, YidC/Oxa1 family [Desulfotomaculum sp. 46_296]
MFQSLVDGMSYLMNLLYSFTVMIHLPNYGLAIILLTVLIKIALYPLSAKQMRSMVIMQQLAPKVKEIQQKYKEKDPQKMQKKVMELYQQHNVNPMSGCLPLIVQLPILIALYRALLFFKYPENTIPSFLWISNLSHVYKFSEINGLFSAFVVLSLPILAGVTTYLQSKMTMTTNDPTQRMMLYTMPVFIAYICMTVPAGLSLYWVVFNVMGIIQQYFINKQIAGIKEATAESGGSGKVR